MSRARSHLANFILSRLADRGESVDHFAHPARDEALFLLLWNTGMRIGEACSLRMDRLDLDELRQVKVIGKSRRERVVPIGAIDEDGKPKRDGGRTIRALRRYLELRPEGIGSANEYVFLSRSRYRLTAGGGNDVIAKLGELAGVENASPHRLRHSYATWYLTVYPGDELGLRRILGHLSRDVLADYVHLAQTTIAQRSGLASPVEAMASLPKPMLARKRLG